MNLKNYGFSLIEDNEGLKTYQTEKFKEFKNEWIELTVYENIYTLVYKFNPDSEHMVASRYIIENEEQLKFLLFNGRLGGILRSIFK